MQRPATPPSYASRRATSTPAVVARAQAGAELDRHRQPAAPRRRARERDRPVGIVEQRRAGAGLAHLRHRAAHVEVDQVGARRGDLLGRRGHHVGVVAEQLHRDRVLVGVDPQQLAAGPLVAVVHREARDHLRHDQPGAVALGLQAHEPVADPGQRGEHDAVRDRDPAERPAVGECLASSHVHGTNAGDGPRRPRPALDRGRAARRCPGVELFDAHTHLGQNDPDGMQPDARASCVDAARGGRRPRRVRVPDARARRLPAGQRRGARGRPRHRRAADPVLPRGPTRRAAAPRPSAASTPGARGIKLHPRAEEFTLDHPQVRSLVALAHERRLPVLIHAGRGIPALGLHAVELAGEFPDARLILAHAGICDLSWIWRVAPDHPNLLFDTAWWMPADLQALFSLVPPGQILFASDAPYGDDRDVGRVPAPHRAPGRALARAGPLDRLRAGAADRRRRAAAGRRARRSASASAPRTCCSTASSEFLMLGALATMRGGDGAEMLALARLGLRRPRRDRRRAGVRRDPRAARRLRRASTAADPETAAGCAFLILAATVARTPDVPVRPRALACERTWQLAVSRYMLRSQISRSPVSVSRSSTSSIVSRTNGTSTPRQAAGRDHARVGAELCAQPPDDPVDLAGEPVHDPAADRVDCRLADQRARLRRARPSAAWRRGRTARRSRSRRPG